MAITAATFQEYEQNGVDTYRVRLRLTDPTRTPQTFDEWFTVKGSTLQAIRDDASRQIALRNEALVSRDLLAGIAINTSIPVTAPVPPAPPAPTAVQLWASKVRAAGALLALGTLPAGALATRRTALVTEINTEYNAASVADRAAAEALL